MTICICCHLSSVMLCAFKVRTVQLLVKVLLLLILEFYFLTYTESDGIGFRSSILPCMSVDFKADVFRSQMVIPAYFIKPNSGVCFQQLQLGILVDVVRFCLLGTIKFHCFTVHFESLSFIHNKLCTFSYKHVLVY